VVLCGREPLAPLRPTTFPPGSGRERLVQPRVHPQPGQDLNPLLSRSGVHTGLDHGCDRVSPIEHAQEWCDRPCVRLAQQRHRPGGLGVKGLAGGKLVLATIQARYAADTSTACLARGRPSRPNSGPGPSLPDSDCGR
jgi:hypothetical protein